MSDALPDPATDPADPDPANHPAAVPVFPPKPFLRVGYDRGAVDEFVTKVVLAVHSTRQTTVSAEDVARVRFPGRRLGRGYRMREVDDYLGAAEALLRVRAAERSLTAVPRPPEEPHHREHHPTWWIYAVAAVLVVAIVVFTLLQT